MIKLAIVTTHPIQYYAPVFRLLSQRSVIMPKVFYTWSQAQQSSYDPGFKRKIEWDIPLLQGYDYTFVENTASKPGSSHFRGIINPSLIQELKDWQPNAILFFGWSYQSHLRAMWYFKGRIPILFRGDSHLLNETRGSKQWIRRCTLYFIYRYIDMALYVGTNNLMYYLRHGLSKGNTLFAPHAVDNERFAQYSEVYTKESQLWRQKLGIQKDDLVFLFAGKFESKKNPILLLNAFLKTNSPGLHLIFVGNGALEAELKDKASGNSNIHFMSFQNQRQMPVVYRLADVFVLPSQGPGETWGLAVNEAMASGLPVLVSDKVGCAVDLVKGGKNGYVFRSEDEQDLVTKMGQMIVSRDQLVEMGKNSEEIIKSWSFEQLCMGIEKGVVSLL